MNRLSNEPDPEDDWSEGEARKYIIEIGSRPEDMVVPEERAVVEE